MAEVNPEGDHRHVQGQILFATIVVKKATKKTLCRFYKRELETKQGKKIEQKGETNSALTAAGEVYLIIEDDSCFSAVRDDDLS